MKLDHLLFVGFVGATVSLLGAGCASDQHTITNPHHPGPAVGQAVGQGVGVVAGNVAGTVVGLGEGAAQGVAAPFSNTTRKIRVWHAETTADGRTIQVPQDIEVDQYGRPLGVTATGSPNGQGNSAGAAPKQKP